MKLFRRIISSVLVFLIASSLCVSGSYNEEAEKIFKGMDSIVEDIFRYDMNRLSDESEPVVTKYKKYIDSVLALGIMENLQNGLFNEDDLLSFDDFSAALFYLHTGDGQEFNSNYREYAEKREVTLIEAVDYLIGILGYNVYKKTDNGDFTESIAIAQNIRLLKGMQVDTSKHITRGEFAQLVFNALEIPIMEQTVFGENSNFTISKNKTILSERFNAFKVEGFLNAIYGLNIYGGITSKKGAVQIDEVTYRTGNIKAERFWNNRVNGYARHDENNDEYTLLFLEIEDKENNLVINFGDFVRFDNSTIEYYDENLLRRVSVGQLKHIFYNANHMSNLSFLANALEYEGEIVLSKTKKYGDYDVAVIKKYDSYVVSGVSVSGNIISFDFEMEYKGKTFIELDDSKAVYCYKNDIECKIEDIKRGNVVTIIQRDDESYTKIIVSDTIITGNVSSVYDNKIIIKDNEYIVSKMYSDKSREKGSRAEQIALGNEGSFYLSHKGIIVGYKYSGKMYAFLKAVSKKPSRIDDGGMIRIYNQEGVWLTLDIAKRAELDGIMYASPSQIVDEILGNDVLETIISYKTNSKEEVIFIDTILDTPQEEENEKRMSLVDTWTHVRINSGENRFGHARAGSRYRLASTPVFVIPNDLDNEGQYGVFSNTTLFDRRYDIDLYNPDEFMRVDVALARWATTMLNSISTVVAVNKIGVKLDDDGYEVYAIEGAEFVAVGNAGGQVSTVRMETTKEVFKEHPNLGVGDVFVYYINMYNKVENIDILISKGGMPNDLTSNLGSNYLVERACGTIVNIESGSANYVTVEINGTLYSFRMLAMAIMDSDTLVTKGAESADLRVGERIFILGRFGYSSVNIIVR